MNPEPILRINQPLQMLAELADIAMELARAAGRQALEQIEAANAAANQAATPAANPAATPAAAPIATPVANQAAAQAATGARQPEPAQPEPAQPEPAVQPARNHTLNFTRLARTIKDVLALEARITAGPAKPRAGKTPPYQKSGPIHDPRRNRIAKCVHDAAKRNPDGPRPRDLDRYLEHRLQEPDIDQTLEDNLPTSAVAKAICRDLGLQFSYAWVEDQDLKRPRPIPEPNPAPRPEPPDG